jgi:hypothetical protein
LIFIPVIIKVGVVVEESLELCNKEVASDRVRCHFHEWCGFEMAAMQCRLKKHLGVVGMYARVMYARVLRVRSVEGGCCRAAAKEVGASDHGRVRFLVSCESE